MLCYPRAGFWERMAAGFLDIVLVSLLARIVHLVPLGFLIALAYFTGCGHGKGIPLAGLCSA